MAARFFICRGARIECDDIATWDHHLADRAHIEGKYIRDHGGHIMVNAFAFARHFRNGFHFFAGRGCRGERLYARRTLPE
jgi:hypothetical protein